MSTFLKNHPFAVEAFFEHSTVLTFAVSKEQLEPLLPEYLTLDSFKDKWGFIAVALVQASALRPKGFPSILGHSFFLIGYRIFVRYRNAKGKRLRGLYILKSGTNNKLMEFFGNIFTHYNYETEAISVNQDKRLRTINASISKLKIVADLSEGASLPKHSPFADWKEARRFAGPLPFTFSDLKEEKKVLIVEGVRQNWQPKPIQINQYKIPFLETLTIEKPVLANAFCIENIPYYWKKGKLETWS